MIFDTFDIRESPIARRLPAIHPRMNDHIENVKFASLLLLRGTIFEITVFRRITGEKFNFLSLSLFNLVTIYCRSMKNRQFRIPKPNTLWKNSGSSTMPLSDVGINRRIERYSKSSLPRNIQIVRTKPVKPYETIRFRNVAVKVNCALGTIFRERQRPSIEEEGGKKGKNAFSYRGGCFCYEFLPLSSTVVQRLARYRKGHV